MSTTRLLRVFTFAAAILAMPLASGCAGASGEAIDDDDDGDATLDGEVAATAQELATCRHGSQSGKIYSFGGGRFRVCWIKSYGPGASADFRYWLRNASGRTRRLKIALNNMPDTKCYTIANGAEQAIHETATVFAGKPQAVKAC